VRQLILIVVLLFIGALAALTVSDITNNGFNALDIVALLVLGLFTTGIVGALLHPPPPD
jgi:hypothetical protein